MAHRQTGFNSPIWLLQYTLPPLRHGVGGVGEPEWGPQGSSPEDWSGASLGRLGSYRCAP